MHGGNAIHAGNLRGWRGKNFRLYGNRKMDFLEKPGAEKIK